MIFTTNLPIFISTAFYLGRSRYAPGTVTSCAFAAAFYAFAFWCPPSFYVVLWITLAFSLIPGTWAVRCYMKAQPLLDSDPQCVTIDEVAGLALSMLAIDPSSDNLWRSCLCALVLFRVFDILKPWPISACEKYYKKRNPVFGIIIDDIIAGGFAYACMKIALFLNYI